MALWLTTEHYSIYCPVLSGISSFDNCSKGRQKGGQKGQFALGPQCKGAPMLRHYVTSAVKTNVHMSS